MSQMSFSTLPEASLPPRALALFDFARSGGVLQGRVEWRLMPRLKALLSGPHEGLPPVVWSLRGDLRERMGLRPQPMVYLQVQAELPLVCQRCLHDMLYPIDETVEFRLVADEPALTQAELEAEDEALPASEPVNVLDLIEDQLILALPIVPMHDHCPQEEASEPASANSVDEEADERQHPFAHLRELMDRTKQS